MKEESCKVCKGTGKVLVPDDDYAEDTGKSYCLIMKNPSPTGGIEYYCGNEDEMLQVPLVSEKKGDALIYPSLALARKEAKTILDSHNTLFVPEPW